jgi:quercetin dioxygenase-like cupin family protein
MSHVTAHEQDRRSSAMKTDLKRTVVIRSNLQGVSGKQMLAWVADAAPGASSGKHSHPYDEFVYVLDGVFVLEMDGKPPATLHPGETGHVPANSVHEGRNGSDILSTRVLVFGLTSESDPIAIPAE